MIVNKGNWKEGSDIDIAIIVDKIDGDFLEMEAMLYNITNLLGMLFNGAQQKKLLCSVKIMFNFSILLPAYERKAPLIRRASMPLEPTPGLLLG